MAGTQPYQLKTISALHQLRRLPSPEHPLISVINFEDLKRGEPDEPKFLVQEFYAIALKRNFAGKMKYGQQQYDFDEGTMFFMAPGQVFSIQTNEEYKHTGWLLLVHPDFLWNTPLAKKIRQYEYFSYAVHEALHLSEKEETTIASIMQNIAQEYHGNMDQFSHDVMIAQLELLFTYSERFYHRQFLTRKITNHQVLDRMESLLDTYFNSGDLLRKGLPTVQYIADQLNMSPNYLSGLLKVLTGKSTQLHIHDKLMEKAKEKLSTTSLSVSEIAYELGFEHPQSFSKLFKTKTNLSPQAFRQSFN
ncbi:helix-turn-helix transcriptional regulator [Chitinophaga sp. G-6-1-13]|uniref:Helix-turn-helix transcriptional regulator n=1 Tax=Chitinophaga fulva TaxID=2728842 RepID=A0A848GPL2_9BACT|nr:response regulator transcription factor [Chitinophaga fulva]NML38962.1 helix-turn-helix transcriptional regulator [Chitinophaga fulva]